MLFYQSNFTLNREGNSDFLRAVTTRLGETITPEVPKFHHKGCHGRLLRPGDKCILNDYILVPLQWFCEPSKYLLEEINKSSGCLTIAIALIIILFNPHQ